MASSPYFIFFRPVPLLCYMFLLISHCFQIMPVLLSHSAMIFVVPLLSLVLEILFGCLGWLPAPTVFQLLPIFFFFLWKEHWPGDADSSSRSVFTAHMRRWQSSFFSGLLPVDGLCGLHGFLGLLQHQMPCGILTWGRSAGWGRK